MSTKLHDPDVSLDEALTRAAASIDKETVTLGELLELVGEQGLLLLCVILVIPFLFPVSIPGISTVFGILIILIGFGITINRVPWLPGALIRRELKREQLLPVFERGADFVNRLQRWMRPRLERLTAGARINRVHGAALMFGGVLLLMPLSIIPFSNTLPAVAILLLAVGMLQRDGIFVIVGYLFNLLTTLYFGALGMAAVLGGQALLG